jgi:hypothetical protein
MNIPEILKMPPLSGLGKRPGILRNQSIRAFFGFDSSFQNCFWNVFNTSDLSQICKIGNVWKLSRPFSRNTLILCSEKLSWSLNILLWKKNCPINSKTVIKNFFHVRLPCKSMNFMVLGYLWKPLDLKNCQNYF